MSELRGNRPDGGTAIAESGEALHGSRQHGGDQQKIAVSVEHVYKVFGRRPHEAVRRLETGAPREDVAEFGTAAVIDASFDVRQGEIFVVMGLSGSGKSTLIRMLNGLSKPTSGTVTVFGQELSGLSAHELRELQQQHISMVFQHFALLPHKTVLENAAYGLEVQGVGRAERERRAAEVLDLVGLHDWSDHYPDELSGGMQQRVGLARALSAGTDILLMDEAFSALDPLIRREMQEQLLDLQHDLGKTIIFITHDLNEAMFLGDRIAVLRDGRIMQLGTPEEILTDPANDYVAQFVQDVDRARVLTAASVMEPVRAVTHVSAGPRAALRVMREEQVTHVAVLDRDRTLLGVASDRDVTRIIKDGSGDLRSVARETITVRPDETLSDLVQLAANSRLPLLVLDDRRRVLGTVPRATLLASLAKVPVTTQTVDVIPGGDGAVPADAPELAGEGRSAGEAQTNDGEEAR